MKNSRSFFIISLLFISIRSFSQVSKDSLVNDQIWPLRVGVGFSLGYPEVPFLNIGAKIQDKYCIDFYIGVKTAKQSPAYFNLGYQLNNVLNKKVHIQFGPSLMVVKNESAEDVIATFGIHTKLTKIFIGRIGVFVSGHAGFPDKRTLYSNQLNANIGIEYYFKRVPILFY